MDSRSKFEDEANSSTAKGSTCKGSSLLSLRKCSSVPRDPSLFYYGNTEPFSNDDVATEILSRLPTCSLLAFKCTATKWNNLISDPSFLRIHYKSSYDVVGLFVQEAAPCAYGFRPSSRLRFHSLVDNKCRLNLDFLSEKVLLVGSSNGIICCRTYKYPECLVGSTEYFTRDPVELVIYLCDPIRKEWITIRPPEGLCFNDVVLFGLASYPFGTSSNKAPSFKLVNVQRSRNDPNVYLFFIYLSDTGKWKMSNEVCSFGPEIREDMVTFVNGKLHWSTFDHHVLTFDVEKESSKLIKLPCCEGKVNLGTRFGESDGYLHYICVLTRELQVWVLTDYDKPVWELKHCLNLLEFYLKNASLFETEFLDALVRNYYSKPAREANTLVFAWSYYNEVLSLLFYDVVLSHNFKTGRVMKHDGTFEEPKKKLGFYPAVVQCHANLVSLGNFVRDDVQSCRKQGRRGAILPCKRPCKNVKRVKANCSEDFI